MRTNPLNPLNDQLEELVRFHNVETFDDIPIPMGKAPCQQQIIGDLLLDGNDYDDEVNDAIRNEVFQIKDLIAQRVRGDLTDERLGQLVVSRLMREFTSIINNLALQDAISKIEYEDESPLSFSHQDEHFGVSSYGEL